MNILSLFDGISCGRVALERAKIPVTKYYASEIDKYSIQVSEKNYTDIIRLGDINNWEQWEIDFKSIDLILAGSPCQGFSIAGKQLAFDDPRSVLFFSFAEILEHVKSLNPNVKFLLENVRMKKEYSDIITGILGVEPVLINSALVSAQNRKRLYWANWEIKQPEDKGIFLKDIIHEMTSESVVTSKNVKYLNKQLVSTDGKSNPLMASMYKGACSNGQTVFFDKPLSEKIIKKAITNTKLPKNGSCLIDTSLVGLEREKGARVYIDKAPRLIIQNIQTKDTYSVDQYIIPFDKTLKILEKETTNGKIAHSNKGGHGDSIYSIHGKSVILFGEGGGCGAKTGLYLFGCITPDRVEKRQKGQRFSEGNKFYTDVPTF